MSLKFFVDHCVPSTVSVSLIEQGYETMLLKHSLPKDSPDEAVIAKASELSAILVSVNGDFADITKFPPQQYGGIISLLIRNRPIATPYIIKNLTAYLKSHNTMEHYARKLILVEGHRIRIKT